MEHCKLGCACDCTTSRPSCEAASDKLYIAVVDGPQEVDYTFKQSFLRATPDFQLTKGYEKEPPGKAEMPIANNWVRNWDSILP